MDNSWINNCRNESCSRHSDRGDSAKRCEPKKKKKRGRVNALSIAPRYLIISILVKFIIFNTFARGILPVDAVCSW